jgi:hypothetical protein
MQELRFVPETFLKEQILNFARLKKERTLATCVVYTGSLSTMQSHATLGKVII